MSLAGQARRQSGDRRTHTAARIKCGRGVLRHVHVTCAQSQGMCWTVRQTLPACCAGETEIKKKRDCSYVTVSHAYGLRRDG